MTLLCLRMRLLPIDALIPTAEENELVCPKRERQRQSISKCSKVFLKQNTLIVSDIQVIIPIKYSGLLCICQHSQKLRDDALSTDCKQWRANSFHHTDFWSAELRRSDRKERDDNLSEEQFHGYRRSSLFIAVWTVYTLFSRTVKFPIKPNVIEITKRLH